MATQSRKKTVSLVMPTVASTSTSRSVSATAGAVRTFVKQDVAPTVPTTTAYDQLRELGNRRGRKDPQEFANLAIKLFKGMTADEIIIVYAAALTYDMNISKNEGICSKNHEKQKESAKGYQGEFTQSKGYTRLDEAKTNFNKLITDRCSRTGVTLQQAGTLKWVTVLSCPEITEPLQGLFEAIDGVESGPNQYKYRKAWFYARPSVDLLPIIEQHMAEMEKLYAALTLLKIKWSPPPTKFTEAIDPQFQTKSTTQGSVEYMLVNTYILDPLWGAWAIDYDQSEQAYKELIADCCYTVQAWMGLPPKPVTNFVKEDEGFIATKLAMKIFRNTLRQLILSKTGKRGSGIVRKAVQAKGQVLAFERKQPPQ